MGKIKAITADLIRDDDGGYSVFCPELDISARGRSMEDAFDKFEEALRDFLDGHDKGRYLH